MKKLIFALALGGCTATPIICPHDLEVDKYGRIVEACRVQTPVFPEREDRDDREPRISQPEPKPEEPKTKPEKPEPKPDPCACGPDWVQKGAA